jgi:hypothetical protein
MIEAAVALFPISSAHLACSLLQTSIEWSFGVLDTFVGFRTQHCECISLLECRYRAVPPRTHACPWYLKPTGDEKG